MREKGAALAETADLTIGYSSRRRCVRVMEHLSVSAGAGELVALIGRNGAGKSTLLRTLVSLQPPIEGTIRLNGRDLQTIGSTLLPRIVSFTSTEPVAERNITVREAVSLGRFPYTNWIGTMTAADRRAVDLALEDTGMLAFAGRRLDSISDGERQRTLIARSLAQDTDLLVMDEPTAFLDLPSRYSIVSLLRKLTREKGKCVVYSTHDLDTALNEADRIWLMHGDGITEGAPEDLILSGTIAHAFESPLLSFSSKEGTFSFVRGKRSGIALEGDPPALSLTEKALGRCGYTVDQKASVKIMVKREKEGWQWTLTEGSEIRCYYTLYDLMVHLSEE